MTNEQEEKPFPFTEDELQEMVGNKAPNKLWLKAFQIYNSDRSNRPLSMACHPCFNKVMAYLINLKTKA